jgi:DNA polymerase/3'-5' exonuclease PolX
MTNQNNIIISEFEKLISFIQKEIDNSQDIKTKTANTFRLRQTKNILYTIKKFPKKITKDTLDEFSELPGIGKGTIDRIKEILTNGKLKELEDFKDTSMMEKKALEELESVVGIGRSHALELIKEGITSVEMLKKAIKEGSIEVNEKIELGVKYYGVFEGNIPRAEITKVNKLISKVIATLNKKYKYDDTNKYIFEICGSYRREKPVSGDIDVLISKMGSLDHTNHLKRIIEMLKQPLKNNNDKPLLVDDMTDNFETKYMGFAQYKNSKVRRIDIRFVPYDSYYSALLYFTGSADLNKRMRTIAKQKHLKLSEYGLTKKDGEKISITNEYDVFKILEMQYLKPNER